ncbi:monocarboxylate transporter 13-like [Branchiostoma floridae]|uniref:Monocarboxylate transporter 13 n=1 Tax=Branchiostoma floridae TaxID=7739 RepID=A0A9J7MFC5_BRAFL|nr:monocarboxylate transporter 13-like [Branchiostoma floridae]
MSSRPLLKYPHGRGMHRLYGQGRPGDKASYLEAPLHRPLPTNPGPVEPPDGGWGWAVVLAGFIIFACTWGIVRSLGVFFIPWREQFPDATAGEIALVQSILAGMTTLAAPVASALGRRFGFRPTIMAGGVVAAAGFSLSWFATRLIHLYITIGFIAGLGSSLCLINVSTSVGRYFTTKRLRANSFITLGSGIGSLGFPPLCQFLLDEYGTIGASVILGGIVLNMTAFGALVRPILLVTDIKPDQDIRRMSPSVSKESFLTDDQDEDSEKVFQPKRFFPTVYCSLLKDTSFSLYLVSLGLSSSFYLISEIYLPPRAKRLGVDDYHAAFLLSIIGITLIAGRVLVALLSKWENLPLNSVDQYATAATLLGLTMLFMPLATSYGSMATYSVMFGLFTGAIIPMMLTATADLVDSDSLPAAFGVTGFLQGVTGLVGPPVSGALRDATGNYDATFLFGGACATLGGLVPFLLHMRVFAKRRARFGMETPSSDDVTEKGIRETYDNEIIRKPSI